MTKRAFKDQNREPDDEIVLKKLALILKNLVIREDSKIVPVADKVLQFLKNFKDKIQSDVLKLTLEGVLPSRKRLECNDTQDDPTDTVSILILIFFCKGLSIWMSCYLKLLFLLF